MHIDYHAKSPLSVSNFSQNCYWATNATKTPHEDISQLYHSAVLKLLHAYREAQESYWTHFFRFC